MLYVQFTDGTETQVMAVFSCPQNAQVYPNQGSMETSDSRYEAYYAGLPAMAQTALPTPTA